MVATEEFFLDPELPARKYQVREALGGMGQLQAVLSDLTLQEAYLAYRTELSLQRRRSTLNRLRQRIRALAAEEVDSFLDKMRDTALTEEEMQ